MEERVELSLEEIREAAQKDDELTDLAFNEGS
jgi:hypothetical protein